jgi:hypothetical protein
MADVLHLPIRQSNLRPVTCPTRPSRERVTVPQPLLQLLPRACRRMQWSKGLNGANMQSGGATAPCSARPGWDCWPLAPSWYDSCVMHLLYCRPCLTCAIVTYNAHVTETLAGD